MQNRSQSVAFGHRLLPQTMQHMNGIPRGFMRTGPMPPLNTYASRPASCCQCFRQHNRAFSDFTPLTDISNSPMFSRAAEPTTAFTFDLPGRSYTTSLSAGCCVRPALASGLWSKTSPNSRRRTLCQTPQVSKNSWPQKSATASTAPVSINHRSSFRFLQCFCD